jgi:hyperosmotically inducible protein
MLKTRFLARYVFGLVLFVAIAGCASSHVSQGTREFLDDSSITAQVKFDINREPTLNMFQIHVDTDKGVVQVSGFVDDRDAVGKAEAIARKVPGVKTVINNLVVKEK